MDSVLEFTKTAVEAYRRTLLIDRVTLDDDNPAPVYRMHELTELITSSAPAMVLEMVNYTFRRLRHKSPRIKLKTLRYIKYTVSKAGPVYKRELQRCSPAIREFCNYQGHPDPLKGDALNKAIRDAAQEAIRAIFAIEDNNTPGLSKHIAGLGNSSFGSALAGKGTKPMLGFGSSMAYLCESSHTGNSNEKNDVGDLSAWNNIERRSQHAHRTEIGDHLSSEQSDPEVISDNDSGHKYRYCASQENRLFETITMQPHMLQPTSESLQLFMSSVQGLDPDKLAEEIKIRLQSPSWQVKLKAVCILEAILHEYKDVSSFHRFTDSIKANRGSLHHCLDSPHEALRVKTRKVLDLLTPRTHQKSEEASVMIKSDAPPLIDFSSSPDASSDLSPTLTVLSDTYQAADSSHGFLEPVAIYGTSQMTDPWVSVNDLKLDQTGGKSLPVLHVHGCFDTSVCTSSLSAQQDLLSSDWQVDTTNIDSHQNMLNSVSSLKPSEALSSVKHEMNNGHFSINKGNAIAVIQSAQTSVTHACHSPLYSRHYNHQASRSRNPIMSSDGTTTGAFDFIKEHVHTALSLNKVT